MSVTLIYALHGFLGQSSDWNSVKEKVQNIEFLAENLFANEKTYFLEQVENFKAKKIFLGYSLGGRIGLSYLKNNSELFDHYVFLSTNPGLNEKDVNERMKRLVSDQKWATKITLTNWDHFLEEWNSQLVFAGSQSEPKRNSKDYNIEQLKKTLIDWSLGQQQDFSEIIQMNQHKITWVVGSEDSKYCAIAENLKTNKNILNYLKVASGHRIWLENPQAIADILKSI